MKRILLLLTLVCLLAGCEVREQESEIAYCVDREGRVLDEERCEADKAGLDAGDIMLLYFLTSGGSHHHYHYGQTVPVHSGLRAPTGVRSVYRASEVVKTAQGQRPLRMTPAPPKPAGWSVRTASKPTTPASTSRPSSTTRPSSSGSSGSRGGRR